MLNRSNSRSAEGRVDFSGICVRSIHPHWGQVVAQSLDHLTALTHTRGSGVCERESELPSGNGTGTSSRHGVDASLLMRHGQQPQVERMMRPLHTSYLPASWLQ